MSTKQGYKNIYDELKNDIINNVYPYDSYLPTESVLAEKYTVSRPTIAKVYNKLQEEGLVVKRPGMGTIVTYKMKQNSHTFGLLLPGAAESEIFSIINERFLDHTKRGLFNCLWEGTMTSSAELRKELIEKCTNDYIAQNVNGIFFAPLERVSNAKELNVKICERIREANIPLVLIDRDIYEFPERSEFDVVSLDNFHAGYTMTEHLIEKGCEVIHFFFRSDSASSVNLRMYGIGAAMQKHHLKFDQENVICGNPEDTDLIKTITIKPGKTGIICANDSTAAVLMSTLDVVGIKITNDLLVCAYDDMKYANHLKYPLTSFRQPCENITDVAIDLMKRRIENKESPAVTIQLTGKIIPRDSTRFS